VGLTVKRSVIDTSAQEIIALAIPPPPDPLKDLQQTTWADVRPHRF
jgi:hypothetical protein